MKLYDYFRSSASYRVRIALNVKNISYEKIEIHLVNDDGQQHSDNYKKLNPQELVPTIDDNGIIINQSMAILDYLENKYPGNKIYPEDIIDRAHALAIANIVACDIHPLNNLRVLQYLENNFKQDKITKDIWYRHWVEKGFKAIENLLEQYQTNESFCIGNKVSIADICLVPQVYNAYRFGCNMNAFPKIAKINESCLKLDCFDAAKP